ncbi:MAG: AMIN domain-containing protein [Gammaproteobacteria bacterium]|nr:AMIN domain-containing protein [Gammaproteobacteria bacterium]
MALCSAGAWQLALADSINRLEGIQTQVLAGNKIELTLKLAEAAPTPLLFTVDNPARIALDLPATAVAMNSRRLDVNQGVLDTVNVAEANGRTRVVLNVDNLVPYETRVQGNNILVTLAAAGATAMSVSSRRRLRCLPMSLARASRIPRSSSAASATSTRSTSDAAVTDRAA